MDVFDEGMDSDFEDVEEDTADSGWPIYVLLLFLLDCFADLT